jgi:SAM-dependent methyltransferase
MYSHSGHVTKCRCISQLFHTRPLDGTPRPVVASCSLVTSDGSPEASDGSARTDAELSGSFGAVASDYERFRPGPPSAAVDWWLPERVHRVVDLGAGTGALTRLLVARADEVVAVEPDDRMRAVLHEAVPGATALRGRAEALDLPDASADAVLASSSWHWVEPVAGLTEVARVLVPGGLLGVVWSGPAPDGPFMSPARALLGAADGDDAGGSELGSMILGDARRPEFVLAIPDGLPYSEPEHRVMSWDLALTADELIGLLGTLSWIITMPPDRREHVTSTARRFLRDLLGLEGARTVDVAFKADVWRSHRH